MWFHEGSGQVCDKKWDEITRRGSLNKRSGHLGTRSCLGTEPEELLPEQRRRIQAWRWAPAWVRERDSWPGGWSSEKECEGHRRAAEWLRPYLQVLWVKHEFGLF